MARSSLMRCLALVAVVALLQSMQAEASKCSTAGGVCKDVSKCSSTTVSGLCPGGNNIRCCFTGQGASCKVKGVGSGKCLVSGYQTCSGKFYTGACDGPAAVRCCVTSSTPPSTPPTSTSWTTRVKLPSKSSMNPDMTALKQSTLKSTLGSPCTSPNTNCANKGLSSKLKRNLRTNSDSATYKVIPFKVRMLKPAVEALARIFTKVKAENPSLYAAVKTAGSLCCRNIKLANGGLSSSMSLHSWGVALDLTIGSKDADRGLDGKTYRGIIALAPYFRVEGFYWGASFKDAMHWEVSSQLFAKWKKAGLV